jgi:Gpi18-like mannosyltransferase
MELESPVAPVPADSTPLNAERFRFAGKMLVVVIVVLGGLAIRVPFFESQSWDYKLYFGSWYGFIAQHGGFSALKYDFANYNVPYLYLIATLTYIPVPALFGIKAISVVFDFLLGFFAYRIVAVRYPGSWWPILAGAVVIYLPTVVLNSSMWAQVDAIYSAFGLGGVHFVLRRRPWLACLFFGLALSFKLQAIFLFPALLLFVLMRRVPWQALLLIPVVYLLLDTPAVLVGANFSTLVKVYINETNTYDQLTLNAPNIYQYWGNFSSSETLRPLGLAVTEFLVLSLIFLVAVRRIELTASRIVLAATVSALVVPYFLPSMHERYFYLADGLTVISAFFLPRRLWPLPILEQFASAFSYAPFLLGRDLIDFLVLSTVMLAALLLALWATVHDFRRLNPRVLVNPGPNKQDGQPDQADPATILTGPG